MGVGLRQPHYSYVLEKKPPISWFEIHTENFLMKGGPALTLLEKICEDYPLSFHGVGLSLGSAEGLDHIHLLKIKQCMERFSPFIISEHLAWSRVQETYLPDLLPIPYTKETLLIFSQNIDQAQSILGREILIENPSSYFEYEHSTFSEVDFLKTLCKSTGARLLLDLNNIFVSSFNHGWDAQAYLEAIPMDYIKEIHLAGHSLKTFEDGTTLCIDDHASFVCDEVWQLYAQAIQRGMCVPTLLEWDEDIPPFPILMKEAARAQGYLQKKRVDYG